MFCLGYLAILVLDQSSKLFAQEWLRVGFNSGIALAWLEGLPSLWVTTLIGLSGLLLAWFGRRTWSKYTLFSAIFWGGVSSNFLDRLLLGGVVDWWPWSVLNLTNNVADLAIILGLMGIGVQIIFHHDST